MKDRSKVIVAVILTIAILAGLVTASPAQAVNITLPGLPTTMYYGNPYSFYAQVDIGMTEQLPITNLRLDISGPTPAYVIFNVDGTITAQSTHFASITSVVTPYFGYSEGYGYGYGYQPHSPPYGYGYFSHWWGYLYSHGYGYGYGYAATTQLKYLVTLNTSGMTLGSYTAQLSVLVPPAPKAFLSPGCSFTLTTAPAGGGGGAAAPARDTIAPTISPGLPGVDLASDITHDSADISFSTNELCTSELDLWASPGTIILISTTPTTSHSITLTSLDSATTYHFKIRVTDIAGNLTISDEYTFTTLEVTPTPAVTPTPGVTPTPTPTPPVEGPAFPWYWIVIGVAGVAVIGGLVWYVWIRPRP